MFWLYGHYKYFYPYSAGIDFRRQNLTSADVRFWRLMSIPALEGLITIVGFIHHIASFNPLHAKREKSRF